MNRDQIVKTARLTGCKNFVGKRKKFILFQMAAAETAKSLALMTVLVRCTNSFMVTAETKLSCIICEIKREIG